MSSTPEQNYPHPADEWGSGTQQGQVSRPPAQPGAPGTEQYHGVPSSSAVGQPQGEVISSGQQPPPARGGYGRSPIAEAQTHVSGRRVVQYFIDAFLVSIVPYLVSIPFDASNSTVLHIIGGIVTFVLFLIIGFWYWCMWPKAHNGQTFAMKWFGIRVVSKDGGPANTVQYFIRWIGLIIDGFPWIWPFTGLLGLFVMVVSKNRQRVGDHMARTLVISEGLTPAQASQYAVDQQAGPAHDPLSQERPETGL